MKIYKRTDGFEVQDAKDRDIAWVTETYGGEWVEVLPPPPPDPKDVAALIKAKSDKKKAALSKLAELGITEEDIKAIVNG
jgi:hypothetical protein